ncbi:hypothetical protein ACHGLA_30815 [Streptomyces sp. YH02]|uniref:hypothetical protein n=1 Tax=Streptomyces sp. YH02 TaxID=3256999 RepID=UPI003757C518
MFQSRGVAHGACDGEPKEIADTSYVAAGGVDFLEDAVFAEGLGFDTKFDPREAPADAVRAGAGAPVDEQVRVDGGRPGPGPVVEVCRQAGAYGAGEGDGPVVDGEAAVADIGQSELLQLGTGQPVERDQRDGQCGGGVVGVEGC